MRRRFVFGGAAAAWVTAVGVVIGASAHASARGLTGDGGAPLAPQQTGGWTIPPTAATEKSPLTATPAVLAGGKHLFETKCQRCHGPLGKGDGPDGDPAHADDMNLTVPGRAARNPDGVVFYKIYNGRETPKMPAQKDDLTKEQIWAIVAYVQTLRGK